MALHTVRTDDLTGEPDAITCVLVVNGKGVEIDLAAKSVERLTKALAPFWRVGSESDYVVSKMEPGARKKKATPSSNGSSSSTSDTGGLDAEERARLRQWADENGIAVPQRGRIPSAIVEHFRAATG